MRLKWTYLILIKKVCVPVVYAVSIASVYSQV